MKYVSLILNWAVALFFLVIGLIALFTDPLPAIPLLLIGALYLPPLQNATVSKFGKPIPPKAKAILALVLLIGFAGLVSISEYQKQQQIADEKAAQEQARASKLKQMHIDEFNANRAEIIAIASSALSDGRYQDVVSSTEKYVVAADSELNALGDQAQAALKQQQTANRRAEILAELKGVPAREYKRNRDLYKKLVALSPNDEAYSKKLSIYDTKYAEKVELVRAETERKKKEAVRTAARKKQIESQFSAWDGSHRNLERAIKQSMNDPDSYEHVETVYWDMQSYLVVKTTFRGKNAFGGLVINWVKAKVDLAGNIISVIEQGP